MKERLRALLGDLMRLPGLSGYEGRVRRYLAEALDAAGLAHRTDRLGNLIATIEGNGDAPSVMLFAHMDQLGFVVRKIEADGLIRVERLGGVPEKALPAQPVLLCVGEGRGVLRSLGFQERVGAFALGGDVRLASHFQGGAQSRQREECEERHEPDGFALHGRSLGRPERAG